jgi:hypothetical protein
MMAITAYARTLEGLDDATRVLQSLEGVYSVGLLGAKTEIAAQTNMRDGGCSSVTEARSLEYA